MNDDPTNPLLARENFTVFEFALVQILHGIPRQTVKLVGEYPAIEDAFAASLERARREAALLAKSFATITPAECSESPITILATEWGYDVRHDHQTITRYWIHPQPGMTD